MCVAGQEAAWSEGGVKPQRPLDVQMSELGGRPTMKTLSFLTHKDIYDQSVTHLFGQKRAALLPRGGAYRGYCGGCPVGNL
ncbi:hypothetical protein OKW45_006680 [Paraburkholderia sp. WSM4175]